MGAADAFYPINLLFFSSSHLALLPPLLPQRRPHEQQEQQEQQQGHCSRQERRQQQDYGRRARAHLVPLASAQDELCECMRVVCRGIAANESFIAPL